MKILFLTSRFPYPLEKGDKLRVYHQIKGLSAEHEIYLASISDEAVEDSSIRAIAPFCKEICIEEIPSGGFHLEKILNWVKGMPAQVAYFYNKKAGEKFDRFYKTVKPDVVICQLLRMAPYTYRWNTAKVLDYMDAFSAGADRQAGKKDWKSLFWKSEASRMRKFESMVFNSFQQHWIISERDCTELGLTELEKSQVKVIPNGIDTAYFHAADEPNEKNYDLVFVGNMGYLPNIQAAQFMIEEVLPLLKKMGYMPSLLIAGARPPSFLKNYENSQIKVSGWMEDIRVAYRSGRIFTAPLFTGSGLQNKLLEAMASGLPCITSPLAGEAIATAKNATSKNADYNADLRRQYIHRQYHKKEDKTDTNYKKEIDLSPALITANDAGDFAKKIIDLLENEAVRGEAGKLARDFVERNYRWPIFIDEMNVNLKNLRNL